MLHALVQRGMHNVQATTDQQQEHAVFRLTADARYQRRIARKSNARQVNRCLVMRSCDHCIELAESRRRNGNTGSGDHGGAGFGAHLPWDEGTISPSLGRNDGAAVQQGCEP